MGVSCATHSRGDERPAMHRRTVSARGTSAGSAATRTGHRAVKSRRRQLHGCDEPQLHDAQAIVDRRRANGRSTGEARAARLPRHSPVDRRPTGRRAQARPRHGLYWQLRGEHVIGRVHVGAARRAGTRAAGAMSVGGAGAVTVLWLTGPAEFRAARRLGLRYHDQLRLRVRPTDHCSYWQLFSMVFHALVSPPLVHGPVEPCRDHAQVALEPADALDGAGVP